MNQDLLKKIEASSLRKEPIEFFRRRHCQGARQGGRR